MSDGELAWKIVLILNNVMALVMAFAAMRRKPPVQEELYKDYATKDDVRQLRSEFLKTTGEIFDVQRNIRAATDETFMEVKQKLGYIDGALSRCPGIDACIKQMQKGRPA
jgi:hypothetical protein